MSTGTPCNIAFYPTAGALADIGNPQDDPIGRDLMIVFDRSGSMSLDAGTGRTKIEEARDAAALFIQLVQSDGWQSGRPCVVQHDGKQPGRFRVAAGQ